jgi:DNA-binding CsgD family transcriptional regulator/transcriptional regulator with XRE-family HTH domain
MVRRLQPFPAPGLGEPGESINATLRSVRRSAGLSLDTLAARTNFSKPYLSNVEAGRRRVTAEIAEAYDAALGTGGLLIQLLAHPPGEPDRQDALVGRTAELAHLHRSLAEVATGQGRVLWIEGEPGIGKSTLLTTGLAGAGRAGCRVLSAGADESLARFPLWVMVDALRGTAETERSQLTALLRGDESAGPAPSDAVLAAAERMVEFIERWCTASPVLLVVDDLQWADEVSLLVWGRLRRLVAQLPLLLIGACRPVPRRPEVAALRRGVGAPDGLVLRLDPLGRDQVTELTGRLAGAPAGPRLRSAVDQAGGNPLYLREMIEALVREQRVPIVDGRAELVGPAVPGSLAAAIGTRLGFLSGQALPILRIAALLGPAPSVDDLGAVTGRPAAELAEVIDEAIAAGVLVTTAHGVAFRHGLIRAALYEQTPPPVREALHRQAARSLARAGAGVEAVAEQLLASGPAGVDSWAAGWLGGGAATALLHRAPKAALELIERLPEPARPTLAGYRIAALSLLGRDEDVARSGPAVLAGTTDVETTGRTAWTLAYSLGRTARRAEARTVLAEVLRTRELDQAWRARLHACDALIGGDQTIARRALAEAERAGDRFATGYALHALAVSYHYGGDPDERAALAAVDRALAVIGDRPETADLRALLLANRVVYLDNLGRPDELSPAIGAALAAAERNGTAARLVLAHSVAAGAYYEYGRWDDALAELTVLADMPVSNKQLVWKRDVVGALIALHRDDRVALAAHLDRYADSDFDDDPTDELGRLRLARAHNLEAAGRPAEALEAALAASVRPGSTPLAPDVAHSCQSAVPGIVRLALALGRQAEAEALTSVVVTRAGTDVRAESTATARHCEGLLAADPVVVGTAVEAYERAGRPLHRGQALENQAVLLAERGDVGAARRAYDAAAEIYLALEATWDLRRAAVRLRPLGLRAGRHRVRRRPATGWEALTPTELKVAALVADGLSNLDVAARLQVSRRTVETHVAHILAKLGGRSRVDIRREVAARPTKRTSSQ